MADAADTALEGSQIWLTPGVVGIGGASLLADVGHEIPTALQPSLLTSTLGAPASALGLIEGVSDALAGVGIGCVETAEHAAVATHATADRRGSAFGLLAGVQSFGNPAASGVAGILWTVLSPSWAFTYLAAWMCIALISLGIGTSARTGGAKIAQQPAGS